jgi:hypothetical protein
MKNLKTSIYLVTILFSINSNAKDIKQIFKNPNFWLIKNKVNFYDKDTKEKVKVTIKNNKLNYKTTSKTNRQVGYFHVNVNTSKEGEIKDVMEFYKGDMSGLATSFTNFDSKGKVKNHTKCDVWSGCVFITKNLCTSINTVFHGTYHGPNGSFNKATRNDIIKCAGIYDEILSSGIFESASYQKNAADNYKKLYSYYSDNINKNAPSSLGIAMHEMLTEGQSYGHDLKKNQTINFKDSYKNRNILGAINNMYSACDKMKPYFDEDSIKREKNLQTEDSKTSVNKE